MIQDSNLVNCDLSQQKHTHRAELIDPRVALRAIWNFDHADVLDRGIVTVDGFPFVAAIIFYSIDVCLVFGSSLEQLSGT